MPMDLQAFLAVEPTLVALRREIDGADRHTLRKIKGDEHALVKLLSARWSAGLVGWLTTDEAQGVAAELQAEAEAAGIAATARVEDLVDGDRVRPYLVFLGGRHGRQVLALSVTSPVRSRLHWAGYLESCPRGAPRQLALVGGER